MDGLDIHSNFVLRHRRCRRCNVRFRTVEFPYADIDKVSIERMFQKLNEDKEQKAKEAAKVAAKSYKESS